MVPDQLRGSRAGVYQGVVTCDYETLLRRAGLEQVGPHSSTGTTMSNVANRVSYQLGLQGPSVAVNTACSSALVAVHLACQGVRAGECDLALAGGVHLNLIPETLVEVSKFGALSPDGRCFTLDARANGYVRGEGGAVLVLRPLSAALRSADRIYAVVRGSAVNNDGPSNGLTAPNPAAQAMVYREACARGGIDAATVDYVELHGTGTPLGDPIEAGTVGEVYGSGRSAQRLLRVGSVKTNLGHLEGAAGIAGLVKAALCLDQRWLPPSLNFTTPNPLIDFDRLGLRLVTQLEPWERPDHGVRRAAVSSFGFGGTNAHVVLEESAGTESRRPGVC